jgi:hypothetical protein
VAQSVKQSASLLSDRLGPLQCQVGDWVTIKLCRPISKTKKFAVVQVNGKKTRAEDIIQQELLDRRGERMALRVLCAGEYLL